MGRCAVLDLQRIESVESERDLPRIDAVTLRAPAQHIRSRCVENPIQADCRQVPAPLQRGDEALDLAIPGPATETHQRSIQEIGPGVECLQGVGDGHGEVVVPVEADGDIAGTAESLDVAARVLGQEGSRRIHHVNDPDAHIAGPLPGSSKHIGLEEMRLHQLDRNLQTF